MVKSVICTVLERNYAKGFGALANSLLRVGFSGQVYVGFRGEEARSLLLAIEKQLPDSIDLIIEPIETDMHLTNYKPFYMRSVMDKFTDQKTNIFYIDPDIIICRSWMFFETWIGYGISVCPDPSYADMPSTHPLKLGWKSIAVERGFDWNPVERYANAGFIGVHHSAARFVDAWCSNMEMLFEAGYIHPSEFNYRDPTNLFMACDQDALNFTLNTTDFNHSISGISGMGFGNGPNYMYHAIGAPKPWQLGFFSRFIKNGKGVDNAALAYWRHANEPVRVESKLRILFSRIDMFVTEVCSRFFGRR